MPEKHKVEIEGHVYTVSVNFYLTKIEGEACGFCGGREKVFARRFRIVRIEDNEKTVVQRRKRYIHDKAFLELMDRGFCSIVCKACISCNDFKIGHNASSDELSLSK